MDHGGARVLVPEQCLGSPDVVISLKEVGSKAVAKNAQLFFIRRHLRDELMQGVFGTSAAIGFQLDLGVKLGVFYSTIPYCTLLGKSLLRNDTETY